MLKTFQHPLSLSRSFSSLQILIIGTVMPAVFGKQKEHFLLISTKSNIGVKNFGDHPKIQFQGIPINSGHLLLHIYCQYFRPF